MGNSELNRSKYGMIDNSENKLLLHLRFGLRTPSVCIYTHVFPPSGLMAERIFAP